MSFLEKYWAKVEIGKIDECWEWTGSKTPDGYGNMWDGRRSSTAHRFAWEIKNGSIPYGMFVCHTCDNPSCQNPAHLFLGTPADNMTDMVAKGRSLKGSTNGQSKLSSDDVREIRRIYATGKVTQDAIAKIFGVAQSNIHNIIYRKKWGHIKESG